jgi:hypothetical protein
MDRRQNKLDNITYIVFEVSLANGEPIRPPSVVASYSGQCGCILRDAISINEKNIRENAELCAILISKMNKRYTFLDTYNNESLTKNLVNTHSLGKFSRDLSSWKTRVQRMVDTGDDYSKVHKEYPMITEEEWETFRNNCARKEDKDLRKWGLDMPRKNIDYVTLGSRGYDRKRPRWENEDAGL